VIKPKDKFRVSSALKTIIGRELITDDFVAVFELVKNAFDAHARNVEILFEGLRTDSPKLVIKDDGKGMTEDDVDGKWLFVAYSAKTDGTEDSPEGKPKDYRDKISSERTFAGAKGIGRFSCDRLGRYLNLYTRAKSSGPYQHLKIDWQDFEEDSSKEFVNVAMERRSPTTIPYQLDSGTILEISGLRENWDRDRLKQLRDSLRKLINPNQENDVRRFHVELVVPEEANEDKTEEEKRDRVNGQIKNFLFEELGLKTTEIHCDVDSKAETITTTLTDRGTLIYHLVERSPYDHLRAVRIHLFALNRSAKMHFKKIMGVDNVSYGSVFLYKNGFRIPPIGDEDDDTLGIGRRKQQAYGRNMGARDLSGRIEITGNDKTFKEVSSRDAGLIDSPEWRELIECFYDFALKRLEKYAVDVIKWGNPPRGSDEEVQPKDVKAQILEVINKLTGSHDVLDLDYDPHLLDILAERQSFSVATALTNFRRIAEQSGNDKLRREVARAERRLEQLSVAKEEAEQEARSERRARTLTTKKLEVERRKNLFLIATRRDPEDQRDSLQHWIKVSAQKMGGKISSLIHDIKQGKIDKDRLLEALSKLQFWLDQTVKVSRIVTKADFNLELETIRKDLSRFIFEYLNSDEITRARLKFDIRYDGEPFVVRFRPMEITILFDNLIDNAIKAHARNMRFDICVAGKKLVISLANDGEAVPKSIMDSLFELGISSRGGSGIGLYTCRDIVKGMGGEIRLKGNDPELGGAAFEIVIFV
jgi:signal transduction histidine kinase